MVVVPTSKAVITTGRLAHATVTEDDRGQILQEALMALNNHRQNLHRNLQNLASDLKWSAVDLMHIFVRLSGLG